MTQTEAPHEVLSPPAPSSRRGRDILLFTLLFGSVLLVCGRTILHHVSVARDPGRMNDDARILIVPFLPSHDPQLILDDYVTRYLRDGLPLGYEWGMVLASKLADPRWLSKVLVYPFLMVLAILVGVAARRLGGWGAAWVSMAIVLTSELFLDRMSGGLPRMFAFPLVAAAAVGLVYGRTYWVCAAVVVGALFYPSAALVCGLVLTALLLLVPARDRGDAADWSLRKRLIILAATAGLSALLLAPTALRLVAYGPTLRPTQAAAYPEIGPGGRFGPRDRPPFRLIPQSMEAAVRTISGPRLGERANGTYSYRLAWHWPMPIPIVLTAVGGLYLAACSSAGRRLLALGFAAVVGHVLANLMLPNFYLPQRYTLYAIPIYIALALPAGIITLAQRLLPGDARRPLRVTLLAIGFGCFLIAMGVGMTTDAGLRHHVRSSLPVMGFLKTLPPDAMIAGWPRGAIEDVPYLTGRRAFVTFETHPPFHQTYTDRMRARATAVIDAYFATDPAALLRLRDEHGVSHLVIDRSHYQTPPTYFLPFNDFIPPRFEAVQRHGPEPLRQPNAIVYDDGTYVVLDLAKVTMPADAGSEPLFNPEPEEASPDPERRSATPSTRRATGGKAKSNLRFHTSAPTA